MSSKDIRELLSTHKYSVLTRNLLILREQMRKLFLIISVLLGILSGCKGGTRAPAEADAAPEAPEAVEETFVPVFTSVPVPADVEARMRGVTYPEDAEIALEELRYLRLSYIDFEGNDRVGEMVCNKAIADDLLAIFQGLYEAGYPIRSIRLMDDFGGDDDASMAADNTSCFNYRKKTGMRELSRHALGLAVDVNPFENPYVRGNGVKPAGAAEYADRTKDFPHKIDKEDICYRLFRQHGFAWGGVWRSVKDYQHFEK